MANLDEWTDQICTALGLPAESLDRDLVLDLARDSAHSVARPAAPLTTYLAGVAVGRGATPADADAAIRALLPPAPAAES